MRVPGLLLIAAIIVAGCADNGDPSPASAPTLPSVQPAGPAGFSETTGGLEGLVTDDEQLPLPGVQVGLLEAGVSTFTDDAGRFAFSDLEPRSYTMQFVKLGYASGAKLIEVVAGQAATTAIVLPRIVTDDAYHYILQQKGMLGCAVQTKGVPTGTALNSPGVSACGLAQIVTLLTGQDTSNVDRFRTVWQLSDPSTAWNTTVLEMVWQSTQALGGGLSVVWEVDLCSGDANMTFAGPTFGRSPIIQRADADIIQGVVAKSSVPDNCLQQGLVRSDTSDTCNAEKCDLQARVFSAAESTGQDADVGVSLQQSFEQFMTNFYYAPGPPEFTALVDG